MCDEYQGYSNYATWTYCLWADNEEGSYNYHVALAQSAKELTLGVLNIENISELDKGKGRKENERLKESVIANMTRGLADTIGDEFSLNETKLPLSVKSDLLQWAIEQIDWFEVAAHYLEDILED